MAALRKAPRQFILLDQNGSLSIIGPQPLVGSIFRRCDMLHDAIDLPEVQAVLADPPWYEDETLAFLRTAARICADQGKVLLSSAPFGVRPGIQEERDRIVRAAKESGLRFLGTEPHVLSYATPFFEHNALRAAGFAHVMPNWRRGDLLTFQRAGGSFSGPTNPMLRIVPEWAQFDVRGATIWVRPRDQQGFVDPSLVPVVPGTSCRRSAGETFGVRQPMCGRPAIGSTAARGRTFCRSSFTPSAFPKHHLKRSDGDLQHSLDHLEAAKVETSIAQVESIVQTELQEMRSFVNGRE